MYAAVLVIHSWIRWLVVISLLYSMFRFYSGWLRHKTFGSYDNTIRKATVSISHLQVAVGILLYIISPLTQYFMHNYNEAVKQREVRFFGMEHGTMMLVAIIIITIGSAVSKKRETDRAKFKTLALFFSVAFFIILLMIPWKFSPMASRPYFRIF